MPKLLFGSNWTIVIARGRKILAMGEERSPLDRRDWTEGFGKRDGVRRSAGSGESPGHGFGRIASKRTGNIGRYSEGSFQSEPWPSAKSIPRQSTTRTSFMHSFPTVPMERRFMEDLPWFIGTGTPSGKSNSKTT